MGVRRTEWIDVFSDDGVAAVFVDGQVTVVSELATTLLDLVGEGAELSALADGLVAVYGAPPGDPLDFTRATVSELVTSGILAVDDPEELARS